MAVDYGACRMGLSLAAFRAESRLPSLPLSLSMRSPWKTVHHHALAMLAVELRGCRPWRVLHGRTPGHALGMSGLATVSSFSQLKRNRKPYTVAPYSLAPVSFGQLAMVVWPWSSFPPVVGTIPFLSLSFLSFLLILRVQA